MIVKDGSHISVVFSEITKNALQMRHSRVQRLGDKEN